MDQYWATLGADKIGSEIVGRMRSYKDYLEKTGMIRELRKSYKTYYGTTEIDQVDQSLQAMHLNHYENLIRHVLVDVTQQRPAWEPRAVNTDLSSQADTQLASGLLDFYMREKHIEPILNGAIETSLFLKEGWVSAGWNVTGGEVYGTNPDNGLPIHEGDIEVKLHTLLDVARDVRRKDMNSDWFIIEERDNKWDLAAKYPDVAEKIKAIKCDEKDETQFEIANDGREIAIDMKSDLIPVLTLRHEKTPALPMGRMTQVVGDGIVLFDGPLPYKKTYIFPATPARKLRAAFGHSNLMNLLPPQDAFNATVSAILTNQAANAVQNFQAPKGAAPKVVAVKDGLNVWEYDPKAGKMESMDLLKTAPEVFNFAEFLKAQMELLSGVSQVSRGNVGATMSGTAMALLAQQAIQFASGVQLSRTLLQESVGTAIIELLQTFAVVPRVAQIVGKSKRPLMREFKGADLKGISRVIVDTANPLKQTISGRTEIANQLLQSQQSLTPHQYINVLTTGNLEPLYENQQSQLNLMKAENERLMEGGQLQAFLTDDHPMHILEHSCVLNTPEARENPKIVEATQMHIQQHLDIAKGMDPALAMILKQQSVFQPPAPPQQGGPAPTDGVPQVMDNQNPVTSEAEQTALPKPAQPPQLQGA